MVNYQNGKVYRIISNQTDRVYIGSTAATLSKRMAEHRSGHRSYLAGIGARTSSSDIVQYDDATIVLVEDCPCENKEQLWARERFHVENTPNCVNERIPGRTHAEYAAVNKVAIAAWQATYRAENKEALARYGKARYEANKDAIRERGAVIVVCECGAGVQRSSLWLHRKSKRHTSWMEGIAPPV